MSSPEIAPANLRSIKTPLTPSLRVQIVAEALGTAFLLIAVVGSGILGERLAAGNTAIALLANALATTAALFALIEWFAPLSGAHFNPVVTFAFALRRDVTPSTAAAYIITQFVAAIVGVAAADAMFGVPIFSLSHHTRNTGSELLSEFVATFGLVGAVLTCSRLTPSRVSGVVAAYIGGAFWFTATDFANPAVALARAFTDTFSGIRLLDVPGFVVSELAGMIAAVILFKWLLSEGPIRNTVDCGPRSSICQSAPPIGTQYCPAVELVRACSGNPQEGPTCCGATQSDGAIRGS